MVTPFCIYVQPAGLGTGNGTRGNPILCWMCDRQLGWGLETGLIISKGIHLC